MIPYVVPPCINCVLHIGPAGSPALSANIKPARLHPERPGYPGTLIDGQVVDQCVVKRDQILAVEHRVSRNCAGWEESAVFVGQYSSDSNGDRAAGRPTSVDRHSKRMRT